MPRVPRCDGPGALVNNSFDPLDTALRVGRYLDGPAARVLVHRDPAAVVGHGDRVVGVNEHVDVFIAGGTAMDLRQLARRMPVGLGDGRRIFVHPPEDSLLQQLRWYRRGGEVSDRQWRDIAAIVRVQGSRLDRAYLREGAVILGVVDPPGQSPAFGMVWETLV
jgi:hypothetical protein